MTLSIHIQVETSRVPTSVIGSLIFASGRSLGSSEIANIDTRCQPPGQTKPIIHPRNFDIFASIFIFLTRKISLYLLLLFLTSLPLQFSDPSLHLAVLSEKISTRISDIIENIVRKLGQTN